MKRRVSLTTHIRILGYIYTALASLVGLLAVVALILLAGKGKFYDGVGFVAIIAPLLAWWLRTGLALLRHCPMARTRAIVHPYGVAWSFWAEQPRADDNR